MMVVDIDGCFLTKLFNPSTQINKLTCFLVHHMQHCIVSTWGHLCYNIVSSFFFEMKCYNIVKLLLNVYMLILLPLGVVLFQ